MKESNILHAEHSLKKLFESFYNISEVRLTPIVGSGSDRLYFRMSADDLSCIGTYVPDADEGRCFVNLSKDFIGQGKAVPEIYAVSADYHCYLQEDLGDKSLFSQLNTLDFVSLVKETLLRLALLQKTPEYIWKPDCINKDFSRRQILWDLNYFKYEYVKPRNVVFNEELLEDDFDRLSGKLERIPDEFCGFMMRDCQSRNVMVTPTGPVFIDFQGGRRGPALYDAVSFLWQARAGFNDDFRKSMLEYYCLSYCDGDSEKKDEMLAVLNEMILFRTLQVLGAYGFRGLVQQKSHFLLSIPGALSNLRVLLSKGVLDCFPELKKVSEALVADTMFEREENIGCLTVEIFSFSYKKGYPRDLSGNGGGFVFDCRALHNPGRYKEYRQLTGRDTAVIEYLEKRGEVQPFLKSVWSLTDAAIERYLRRGFSHIQIGFGCTGGQHRSVYSAEQTAVHVRETFPEAVIRIVHREHPTLTL